MIVAVLGLVLFKSPSVVNKNCCSYSDEELCGCCYLTDIDVSKITGRKFAVLVIEFEEGISKKDVIELKKSCKLVLVYINFGYAENWRDYWSEIKNEN